MNEEFNELYDMLSTDREDVKYLKQQYETDLNMLFNKIREYTVTELNIKEDYNLETNFNKYKTDEIFIKYNLKNDLVEYKLLLLNQYLSELNKEKELNNYIKEKETSLSNENYLKYTSDNQERNNYLKDWCDEFKKLGD